MFDDFLVGKGLAEHGILEKPSNLTKIITTGRVRWKHGLEFLEVLGIFCHTPTYYMLWVV
jgi:hypothetical protein